MKNDEARVTERMKRLYWDFLDTQDEKSFFESIQFEANFTGKMKANHPILYGIIAFEDRLVQWADFYIVDCPAFDGSAHPHSSKEAEEANNRFTRYALMPNLFRVLFVAAYRLCNGSPRTNKQPMDKDS